MSRRKKDPKAVFLVGYEAARRKPLIISWVRWHLERRPLADWERELLGLPVPWIQRRRKR